MRSAPLSNELDADRRRLLGSKIRHGFVALIGVQVLHALEEYRFRLFETFLPAEFVSALISNDKATGFLIANTVFVAFGGLCYFLWVRRERRAARACVWAWAIIELANGAGHSLVALSRGAYFPGLATAPVLIVIALLLMFWLTIGGDGFGTQGKSAA